MSYPYCDKNILEEPQKYMYPPFGGSAFLKGYLASRKNLFVHLAKKTKPKKEEDSLTLLRQYLEIAEPDPAATSTLSILRNLTNRLLVDADWFLAAKEPLDRLVGKFEVTKKLYAGYSPEGVRISEDFKIIMNYALLSYLCGEAAKQTGSLKYLNAQIKLNDLLGSVGTGAMKSDEATVAFLAVTSELSNVRSLMQEKGIQL